MASRGRAIATAPSAAAIQFTVLSGTVRADLPQIEQGCSCDLLLFGVLPSTQTAVGRGENAGRLLHEFNVVRQIYPLGHWDGKAALRTLNAPALPVDASLFVLLAQRTGDAQIVAVGSSR